MSETTQAAALAEQLTTLVADLAGQRGADAQAVAQLDSQLTPNLLRGEAIRLQLQAAEILDEADRLEFKAQLREAVLQLDAPFEAALQEEERLVQAVEEGIQAERQAEDEARAAVENHRLAVEAERAGQHQRLTASEQTELLMRARAAADVATRFQAAAEGATAHRQRLEGQLAAARQRVRECEAASQAASTLAANPPLVPVSPATALLDGFRRLMYGQQLDEQARALVAEMIGAAAGMTGVARQIQAKAVDAHDRELANRAFERNMPKSGHPLRPSNPASPVFAVRPPS